MISGYIIVKEGTKPICFNKDLAENLSERKCVGAVAVRRPSLWDD